MADQQNALLNILYGAEDFLKRNNIDARKDSVVNTVVEEIATGTGDDTEMTTTTTPDSNFSVDEALPENDITSPSSEQQPATDPSVDLSDSAEEQPLDTAAQKGFATYELVEQILLKLPKIESCTSMKTILLAQRVNKTFQHVIKRSLRLQQILGFKPTAAKKNPDGSLVKGPTRWSCNQLLVYHPEGSGLPDPATLGDDFMLIEQKTNAGAVLNYYALPYAYSKDIGGGGDAPPVVESWTRMLVWKEPQAIKGLRVVPWLPFPWEVEPLNVKSDCTMGRLWKMVQKKKKLGRI